MHPSTPTSSLLRTQVEQPPTDKTNPLSFLSSLLFLFLLGLLFTHQVRAEEHTEHTESGQLIAVTKEGHVRPMLHVNTEVDVDINGMIAKVVYRQQFKNDSLDWQEAIYQFPLAEHAAVNHMEMTLGNRRILGQIKEKQEAKRIYEQAKSDGKRAAITEQQRPNLFTQKVANIGPGEEITVELHYIQPLLYQHGQFDFYLPTTLTPRYIPGNPIPMDFTEERQVSINAHGWGVPTDEVPDAAEITPHMIAANDDDLINPISISIRLNTGFVVSALTSPLHQIDAVREGDSYRVTLQNGQTSMDRDFRLQWQPIQQQAPEAALFSQALEGEHYLNLMLMPPRVTSAPSMPREMIFVMDTSGSMDGVSIQQARSSLLTALNRLRPNDRFNLIEFNSTHTTLFDEAQLVSPQSIAKAKAFIRTLRAQGGTNMSSALNAALHTNAPEGYLKQVVFVTDGAVGNETSLFNTIQQKLGDARLFTVGIGSAPNSFFMTKAAQFGRGSFTFIHRQSEVQQRMSELFSQLESPMLTDIRLQWPFEVEQYPERSPDLYAGQPLVISAKTAHLSGKLVVTGKIGGERWRREISLDNTVDKPDSGVGTVWARSKIETLMDKMIIQGKSTALKEAVVNVALTHKLVTQFTSLVAVEEEITRTRADLRTTPVPNAVAKGQVQQLQSYPQTSTGILGYLVLSLILLSGLLVLHGNPFKRRLRYA